MVGAATRNEVTMPIGAIFRAKEDTDTDSMACGLVERVSGTLLTVCKPKLTGRASLAGSPHRT
eukprot:scaffold6174_cov125-Isochrysis_galbana.AAC.3